MENRKVYLDKHTNLLQLEEHMYPLVDVDTPNVFRNLFHYDEIPKIAFNDRIVPHSMPDEIWITDTTFRDGQQSRAPYSTEQIVTIFDYMHQLGGPQGKIRQSEFFLYSKKDRDAVYKCMERGYKFPEITSWIRASKKDFELVKDLGMKETGILTVAVAIIAAAVYFFLVPSHASVSSISGLGIVLSNFIPMPLSAITMILNVLLLIIGFFTCGKEFGIKTVYTSIMLPLFLGLFEFIFPENTSMTGSQELDVLCYILVVSIGLSILFNRNASSGGLDIVAKIMNKYLHMELGKAMSLSGMCVALSAALVYDKKTVVLSILGTYFNGIILDHFIFNHNIKRRVCIITEKEAELRQFILNDLHSGATIYESIGAYNMQKRNEIITIVDKSEYQKLMNYMSHEDPLAFITVYNVSDMRYQPKR